VTLRALSGRRLTQTRCCLLSWLALEQKGPLKVAAEPCGYIPERTVPDFQTRFVGDAISARIGLPSPVSPDPRVEIEVDLSGGQSVGRRGRRARPIESSVARPGRAPPGRSKSWHQVDDECVNRERLLTIVETAEMLGCSARTIRRRIGEGALPAFRDRGLVRVREGDFERYVAANVTRAVLTHGGARTGGVVLRADERLWDE
jgi:excisionase family DNA binding protein